MSCFSENKIYIGYIRVISSNYLKFKSKRHGESVRVILERVYFFFVGSVNLIINFIIINKPLVQYKIDVYIIISIVSQK